MAFFDNPLVSSLSPLAGLLGGGKTGLAGMGLGGLLPMLMGGMGGQQGGQGQQAPQTPALGGLLGSGGRPDIGGILGSALQRYPNGLDPSLMGNAVGSALQGDTSALLRLVSQFGGMPQQATGAPMSLAPPPPMGGQYLPRLNAPPFGRY